MPSHVRQPHVSRVVPHRSWMVTHVCQPHVTCEPYGASRVLDGDSREPAGVSHMVPHGSQLAPHGSCVAPHWSCVVLLALPDGSHYGSHEVHIAPTAQLYDPPPPPPPPMWLQSGA
jgi:hypothetical protein